MGGTPPCEELYDLQTDPFQMTNIAADPAFAQQRAALEKQLFDELRRTGDPRLVNDGQFFETPPLAGPVNDKP